MKFFQGLGASFYPEHHPRETWKEYIKLMAEAGISFVRMGEFAWDKLEPEEGKFDFAWLDYVFSLLSKYNIKVLLCTPTAVPPIWACQKYPEIHPVLKDGRTFGFGLRRYTCPTSPAYHDLCKNIVSELAGHYADSPQIIGWQIDNEFGFPFCFCPRCLQHFQAWCEKRFGTIENFNKAHETHFLGQTLQRFDQIPFPNTYPNPSLWMSYHKFFSEMTIECFRKQVDGLKSSGVKVPVTSNMMITWYGYDHEEMAKHFDIVSGDHYSGGNIFGTDFEREAFASAYLRGMKGGSNIWYTELQCGRTGRSFFPLPGQVRWWTLTQVGLGADLLCYFRWDTCPSGLERDSFGLLKPCRQPGRIFQEIKKTVAELKKVKPWLDGTQPVRAEVAVLYTYENHYEFAETEKLEEFSGPAGNGYALHLARHFRALAKNNIPVDIIYPGGDFSKYKCIIAPALYVLPKKLGDKINAYIKQGGKFLLTSFSGVVDENAKAWDMPVPGPVRGAFAIRVLDYGKYLPEMGELKFAGSKDKITLPSFKINRWIDEIIPDSGTEIIATYAGKYFHKTPVFTRNKFGKGEAYYLGTFLKADDYSLFYKSFLELLRIKPMMNLPEGVHLSCRVKKGTTLYFISNERGESKEVELSDSYVDVVTGQKVSGRIKIPGFGVWMLSGVVQKNLSP